MDKAAGQDREFMKTSLDNNATEIDNAVSGHSAEKLKKTLTLIV